MRNKRGFSLIEVMIVVAIVGILAGIAYPSYMNMIQKSNRSDAKVELNDVAQRLQRCYTVYSAYNNANCGVYNELTTGNSNIISREGFYSITLTNVSATSYELTATPQAGTPQTNDKCTALTLTNAGVRGATGGTVDECW